MCRFRVVYRLVSGVYVMAVAPVFMNIFFSTQLVNAIVHRLCTINRSVNLTPEKLISRFPEVRAAAAVASSIWRHNYMHVVATTEISDNNDTFWPNTV